MLGFPVELVAEILSELDVPDLIHASQVSRGMRAVVADAALNPWRRAVKRALRAGAYSALRPLNGCTAVPEQTWIEILAVAPAPVVLFDACIPRLAAADWADAFARRFLPAWRRWKRDASWKEVYLRSALPPRRPRAHPTRLLYRVWHRALSSCSADESWTKFAAVLSVPHLSLISSQRYIALNRNGSACELHATSRNFNPFLIFNQIKSIAVLSLPASPTDPSQGSKLTWHTLKLVSESVTSFP